MPADERPTISQVNTVHLAWDVMVGLGTLLFLLSVWYWACWIFRRDMPRSKLFLRIASCAGVAAIICMEAGWVVSEVGRQPWIVYNLMKVEDAATANTGVWVTFVARHGALPRTRRHDRADPAHDEQAVPRARSSATHDVPVRSAGTGRGDRRA